MQRLTDEIRVVVNELIDAFGSKGEAEWVSEFAHELPARVFLALMDWPLSDAPMFSEAANTILFGKPGGTEEESNQARMMAGLQMFGYFQTIVEERRANPGEDITSTLIHTEVKLPDATRLLTDEELNRMFFLLLIGGLHTVQGSLAWSILHLSQHPDQRAEIIADLTAIPKAVEEILRYEAAIIPGGARRKTSSSAASTSPRAIR
jgi:cytochrome P450